MGPEITRYGEGQNQTRACSFDLDGITVLVRPISPDDNERALAIARELAGARETLAEVRRARPAPRKPARIFADGCVRFDSDGTLWLLSGCEKGWGAFGYWFRSRDDLFREFDVRVKSHGVDAVGAYWMVGNQPVAAEAGREEAA